MDFDGVRGTGNYDGVRGTGLAERGRGECTGKSCKKDKKSKKTNHQQELMELDGGVGASSFYTLENDEHMSSEELPNEWSQIKLQSDIEDQMTGNWM